MSGQLYSPGDVDRANELYEASCGHAALAALVGREIIDVLQKHVALMQKPYINTFMMEQAMARFFPCRWKWNRSYELTDSFPESGLVLLQWTGPWMQPGLPIGAQLSRTHWIAVNKGPYGAECVYDINQREWTQRQWWAEETLPRILATHKNATGWYVRAGYEVYLADPQGHTQRL